MKKSNIKFSRESGSGYFIFLSYAENSQEIVGYVAIDTKELVRILDINNESSEPKIIKVDGLYTAIENIDTSVFQNGRIAEITPIYNPLSDQWYYASDAEIIIEKDIMLFKITLSDQTIITSPFIHISNRPAVEKIAAEHSIDLEQMGSNDIEKIESILAFRRMIVNKLATDRSMINHNGYGNSNSKDNSNNRTHCK